MDERRQGCEMIKRLEKFGGVVVTRLVRCPNQAPSADHMIEIWGQTNRLSCDISGDLGLGFAANGACQGSAVRANNSIHTESVHTQRNFYTYQQHHARSFALICSNYCIRMEWNIY